jgi:hypothetical protein
MGNMDCKFPVEAGFMCNRISMTTPVCRLEIREMLGTILMIVIHRDCEMLILPLQ